MDFRITKQAFIDHFYGDISIPEADLIKGLNFDSWGVNDILSQYGVYKGNELVGYIRLRGGDLSASFPNHLGKNAYYHKFEEYKGMFESEKEKRKYFYEIANKILTCIEEYDKVKDSTDENLLLNYYLSLVDDGKTTSENYKEKMNLHGFMLFMWIFGCERTVKIIGLEKVKAFFNEGERRGNEVMHIDEDFFIEDLPGWKAVEDYTWLKKIICENPNASEEQILKLYQCPIDTEKELNKQFPNRQPLPMFGAGSGYLFSLDCSKNVYGTLSFRAGINAPGTDGNVVVYLNGERTDDKQIKEAVLKGLNTVGKGDWVCVVSLILRTSAFNLNRRYNEERRKLEFNGDIKEDCLQSITSEIGEITEECAWWEWVD